MRFTWPNGEKLAGAAWTLAVAAVAITLYGFLDDWLSEPYDVIGNYKNPQRVVESVVPMGGSIHVEAVKCNISDQPASVVGEAHWRRIDDEAETLVPYLSGSRTFYPADSTDPAALEGGWIDGCLRTEFENILSPEVGPGVWILEGQDCAYSNNEKDCVGWRTESFIVVKEDEDGQ